VGGTVLLAVGPEETTRSADHPEPSFAPVQNVPRKSSKLYSLTTGVTLACLQLDPIFDPAFLVVSIRNPSLKYPWVLCSVVVMPNSPQSPAIGTVESTNISD